MNKLLVLIPLSLLFSGLLGWVIGTLDYQDQQPIRSQTRTDWGGYYNTPYYFCEVTEFTFTFKSNGDISSNERTITYLCTHNV